MVGGWRVLCSVSAKAGSATKREGCQRIISLVATLVLKWFGFSVIPLSQTDELTVQLHFSKFKNAALCAEVKPTSRKAPTTQKEGKHMLALPAGRRRVSL